jgi:hypothetical protein
LKTSLKPVPGTPPQLLLPVKAFSGKMLAHF